MAGDLGIHKIDLIRFLLDDEVAEISSFDGALDKKDENGKPIEVCDNMVSILRMKSGVLGTASFSWTYYGDEDNSTILYCENGIMSIYTSPEYQISISRVGQATETFLLEEMQTNDKQTSTGVIDAFVDSILRQAKPPVGGADGLQALRIINAALESARTGQTVKL